MCYENEEWSKTWKGIDLPGQNWHEENNKFWPKYLKISENCTLMSCFWPKCILLELKKYRSVIFHNTQEWCKVWGKTDFCFENNMKNFARFNCSTWKSQNWDCYVILLLKVENLWAQNLHERYVLWQWRMKQNLKGIDLSVQNWHEEFNKFWPEQLKF